jgi:hypothetical protein
MAPMARSSHGFSSRRLFQLIVGFFAALQGGAANAAAESPPVQPHVVPRGEALGMPAFVARLRQDATLRARFARDPRAVMREHGIDPSPFQLMDRRDETGIEAVLTDWTAATRGRVNLAQTTPSQEPATPPVAVYGPPPAGLEPPPPPPPPKPEQSKPEQPKPQQPKPEQSKPEQPKPKADRPSSPAPVYGPPAGPPRQRPDR